MIGRLMALAATTALALHFTAHELGADQPDISPTQTGNLYATAAWLESARSVLNGRLPGGAVYLRVVSGWRNPTKNAAVGGAPDSDHMTGLAADFEAYQIVDTKAVNVAPYAVYLALQAARQEGALPMWDQLIYYAGDDHVHVGLGVGMRRQVLVKTTEGSYLALAGDVVSKLRGFV